MTTNQHDHGPLYDIPAIEMGDDSPPGLPYIKPMEERTPEEREHLRRFIRQIEDDMVDQVVHRPEEFRQHVDSQMGTPKRILLAWLGMIQAWCERDGHDVREFFEALWVWVLEHHGESEQFDPDDPIGGYFDELRRHIEELYEDKRQSKESATSAGGL